MALGVYIHIPYCLQRCPYCDFSTYDLEDERIQSVPPQKYVQLLQKEIRQRLAGMESQSLDTIYFGGGTPSLIDAEDIVAIIDELAKGGFPIRPEGEITLEINPATIDHRKMETYLKGGINRFSVGAQTFDENLLKVCGRKHSAKDTLETLKLLNDHQVNHSLDLLFALPGQSESQLKLDLSTIVQLAPAHVSTYCLTLPEAHPMQHGRPSEDHQIQMFSQVQQLLEEHGYQRYEISNFAKPGMESRHNLLYWQDESFLGFGLSAHSYLREPGFGARFWNAASMAEYVKQIENLPPNSHPLPSASYPDQQIETLSESQSLTDFCHTSLRLNAGLQLRSLQSKFSPASTNAVQAATRSLENGPWLERIEHGQDLRWRLTEEGLLASNQVFEKLTFLPEDIA